jgi:hypothetical protein
MLVTSVDVVWFTLAFAIFWIGMAIGFAIFYFAFMIREWWFITSSIRKKIQAVEKVMTAFKGKVENTASFVPPLIDAVTKIIESVAEKKRSQASGGKKRKK